MSPPPSSTASERGLKVRKIIQKDHLALFPYNLETQVFMKNNLGAIGSGLDLRPTSPGLALPNVMCYEEARAGSENSCDVEDELDSVE